MNQIEELLQVNPEALQNRLGCIVTHERDPRNKNYPLKAIMPKKASKRTYRYWDDPVFLDQGNTPSCVGHAWSHWRLDSPVKPKKGEIINPFEVYDLARDNDEFEGNDYEGSSTLGGAKAAQIKGWLKEYRWGNTMEELFYWLLEEGEVVIGSWWHWGMFVTDKKGNVSVSGGKAGGHEYIFNGINMKEKKVRLKNSWKRSTWGLNGRGWVSFDNVEKLVFDEGDMCFGIENK